MDKKINNSATDYLRGLKRVSSVKEAKLFEEDVLLLPENIDIIVEENSNVRTIGFDRSKDIKAKDLLRIIQVQDAQLMDYTELNVLSPSVYVHSLQEKPWHITTQGFLVTRIEPSIRKYIEAEAERSRAHYCQHAMDQFWLPCSKPIEQTTEDDLVCIFNRRISGWDGSLDRPVIELLGAGGHLQSLWDEKERRFKNRTFSDNLMKEFDEEIGLEISDNDIQCIGGFKNEKTQELVILSCIYIDCMKIPEIQKYALDNLDEDTDGIYLGTFQETIKYYRENPSFFAGGEKAAKTNFPNNDFIVDGICKLYSIENDI